MDFINLPILIFSILLSISILTSLVSLRIGMPLILIFLCIGLLAGSVSPDMLEAFRRPRIAFFIGSVALAIILFDSGFHTQMNSYHLASKASLVLATLGVILTTVLLVPVVLFVLEFDWISATLLACIISSTDAAAVFFLLRSRGMALREKVKATLEVESGSNDPMAIFLTLSCITLLQQFSQGAALDFHFLLPSFLGQLFIGAGMGFLTGEFIRFCLRHVYLETALYPIFVLALALLSFALTNILGGSGFLAIYIAGLIAGNSKLPSFTQISRFQKTAAWLSQILMFTTLGIFVTPGHLSQAFLPGLLIAGALTFFARPVTVFALLAFFRSYSLREKAFISFVGLRGATSILLALTPIVYHTAHADIFFNIIFVMVLFSLAVQGYLIPLAARWCGVILPVSKPEPEKNEIDLPGLNDGSLTMYRLTEESPVLNGMKIPKWAEPSLIVRNGMAYSFNAKKTLLKTNDRVYVFSPSDTRQSLLDALYGSIGSINFSDMLGDFAVTPSITFGELSHTYNIKVKPELKNKTLAEVITTELPDVEIGDRISLDSIDLVVRSVENNKPTGIGIDIDPSRKRSFKSKTYVLNLIHSGRIDFSEKPR